VRVEKTGPIHVELISIGREILRGNIPDSNAVHLAGHLSRRGALVHRITAVDDSDRAITSAITEALERESHLVVTTGGLGPTADDRTLGALADALKRPLAVHPHAREMVESAYRRLHERGLVALEGMTAARQKICSLPIGSEPVPNAVGTAPGVLVRLPGGAAVLCLPGVPEEMRAVFDAAIPMLKDLIPNAHVARREVEAPTADESALRPLLDRMSEEFPAVWVKSHAPGFGSENVLIRVTLEASARTRQEAETMVEGALRRLLALAARG
jgi:molybdenum cofactor synthesis domain-containing protein